MARVDMASLYRAVKREPKEGTIGEAVKCHAQACGFVAYIADVHPDEVARVVAGAKFADRPRRPRPRAHRTGGSMTDQRFTDEDREQLRKMGECYGRPNPYAPTLSLADSDATRAALAHIDRLEGALREIAGRECDEAEFDEDGPTLRCPEFDMDRWCPPCLACEALDPAPTEQEEA